MKKILLTLSIVCTFMFLSNQQQVSAQATTHIVKQGESFYSLSQRYGQPVAAIKRINSKTNNSLKIGERLTIPTSISSQERQLLAKLVYAEAKGESYAGKVAVATVILNRVDSKTFPDSVRGVVYEVSPSGHYAFSPVKDGAINNSPDTEARKAVNEAISFRGQGSGSLYFYNPRTATSGWVATRQQTVVIGNHVFAK
ncbi:cell wall hydrolase [Bacillus solitudinis]|uniref:cell wall hydrolase n=1 Tax=Bacillus solitudinis TaxID=2014074 RepID=UPI000C23BE48|nr:cell wall hydrolase [Bacillus solitudinis]